MPIGVQPVDVTDEAITWLSLNSALVFVLAVAVFLLWHFTRPIAHRVVMRFLRARERGQPGGVPAEESERRAVTLEGLVDRLVRSVLVLGVVVVVMGALDLWPAIAGLGLVLAAITLAGQSVVLDYIMGVVILAEGQYYVGDTVRVGTIEGEVEDLGLRRTVIRDGAGIVHSVSNGVVRVSSNLTRVYAVAIVDIQGVRNADLERVIAIMDQVGQEMAADPDWEGVIVEPPAYAATVAFTDLGVTLRMTARVRPSGRGSVPAELRRRLAVRLAAAAIHLARRTGATPETDVPPPGPTVPPPGPNQVLMP